MDMSQQNISLIESDKEGNISLFMLEKISEKLEINIEELIGVNGLVVNSTIEHSQQVVGYNDGTITMMGMEVLQLLLAEKDARIADLQAQIDFLKNASK